MVPDLWEECLTIGALGVSGIITLHHPHAMRFVAPLMYDYEPTSHKHTVILYIALPVVAREFQVPLFYIHLIHF